MPKTFLSEGFFPFNINCLKKIGVDIMPFRCYKYELDLKRVENKRLTNQMRWMVFTYNYFLRFNAKHYKKHNSFIPLDVMKSHIPVFRSKYKGIPLMSDELLAQSVEELSKNLNTYIDNPSKRIFYKKPYETFTLTYKNNFYFNTQDHTLNLGIFKSLKLHYSRPIKGRITSVDVTKKAGKWYVTFVLKLPSSSSVAPLHRSVGIDVGLKEFAILSDGNKIENPRFYRRLEHKLSTEQRNLSRKTKYSNNWVKQREKVQKAYMNLIHYRTNFLHQITSRITDDFDVIGIENLNILDMTHNKKLRKSILDASWGEFIKMLKYKADEKGKRIIEVGRFYPSSQLCSKCQSRQIMPLHLRLYQCKKCGHEMDRDYNASINIERRAVEILQKNKESLL
jgi:putative transposase